MAGSPAVLGACHDDELWGEGKCLAVRKEIEANPLNKVARCRKGSWEEYYCKKSCDTCDATKPRCNAEAQSATPNSKGDCQCPATKPLCVHDGIVYRDTKLEGRLSGCVGFGTPYFSSACKTCKCEAGNPTLQQFRAQKAVLKPPPRAPLVDLPSRREPAATKETEEQEVKQLVAVQEKATRRVEKQKEKAEMAGELELAKAKEAEMAKELKEARAEAGFRAKIVEPEVAAGAGVAQARAAESSAPPTATPTLAPTLTPTAAPTLTPTWLPAIALEKEEEETKPSSSSSSSSSSSAIEECHVIANTENEDGTPVPNAESFIHDSDSACECAALCEQQHRRQQQQREPQHKQKHEQKHQHGHEHQHQHKHPQHPQRPERKHGHQHGHEHQHGRKHEHKHQHGHQHHEPQLASLASSAVPTCSFWSFRVSAKKCLLFTGVTKTAHKEGTISGLRTAVPSALPSLAPTLAPTLAPSGSPTIAPSAAAVPLEPQPAVPSSSSSSSAAAVAAEIAHGKLPKGDLPGLPGVNAVAMEQAIAKFLLTASPSFSPTPTPTVPPTGMPSVVPTPVPSVSPITGCYQLRPKDFVHQAWSQHGDVVHDSHALFKIVSGLAGRGTVSIESCNKPGHFYVHREMKMVLAAHDGTRLFREASSFFERKSLFYMGYLSFEAFDWPDHFVAFQKGQDIVLRKRVMTKSFKQASSWEVT